MRPAQTVPRILIIGVGNAWRGDDALGLVVAQRLRALLPATVTSLEASGDGTALLSLWRDADVVFLVDAVQSGVRPGTVQRFEVSTQPLSSQTFRTSTHAFGLAEAIELARALGQLPTACIVYGVEGAVWDVGAGLSAAVEASVPAVVRCIQDELQRCLGSATPIQTPQAGL